MTEDEWRGGLAPHYDYMLPGKPDDPAMRESASIWLFEENGAFALHLTFQTRSRLRPSRSQRSRANTSPTRPSERVAGLLHVVPPLFV